jgi:hypothetical protein
MQIIVGDNEISYNIELLNIDRSVSWQTRVEFSENEL